jgi:hypothetical protein
MNLRDYAIAFLATIVLEVAVAIVLGYRRRSELACVVWINIFSHPLLNYLVWTIYLVRSGPIGLAGMLFLECFVVIIEWQLLRYALPKRRIASLFVLSLIMNGVSYLGGILFFGVT